MNKKLLYWTSIVLSIFGVIVATYMTIYKLTSNNAMCLGSGDCSTVNSSAYASVYGIPVALIGVLGYLTILFLLYAEEKLGAYFKKNSTMMIFGAAVTGFAFTLYLVYLELYVINAICPFCVSSQITMTILFIISVIRLINQE